MTTISPKKDAKFRQKVNQRQSKVFLEQQIYARLENFTPTLLVMFETFRRSADISTPLDFLHNQLATHFR